MEYCILSYSHKNTNLNLRQKLALDYKNPQTQIFLKSLVDNKFISEAIILATCNRVEFILSSIEPQKAQKFLLDKLSNYTQENIDKLEQLADFYEGSGAIHHLFSVASSLDSLVIGETQIAGQLRSAFKYSYDLGYCNQELSRAIHYAFRCAAQVRNNTDISKNSVSIASASVAQAQSLIGSLKGVKALVIGAGEMSVLACKHLLREEAEILLVNRNINKAKQTLQEAFNGNLEYKKIQIAPLEALGEFLNSYTLVFSATGASYPIIKQDDIKETDFQRYWFDLAVPRDIEAKGLKNLEIFSVDDLQSIVNQNLALREEQAKIAYGIIGKFTQEFFAWLQTLNVEPLIKMMHNNAKEAILKELNRGISKGFLPKEYEKNIQKTLEVAFNTFLHTPTKKLKAIANSPKGDGVLESMRYLFDDNLKDFEEAKMLDNYKCEYSTEEVQNPTRKVALDKEPANISQCPIHQAVGAFGKLANFLNYNKLKNNP